MTDTGITLSPKQWGELRERAARAADNCETCALEYDASVLLVIKDGYGVTEYMPIFAKAERARLDAAFWRSIAEGKV